jgi:hypothetical protein
METHTLQTPVGYLLMLGSKALPLTLVHLLVCILWFALFEYPINNKNKTEYDGADNNNF